MSASTIVVPSTATLNNGAPIGTHLRTIATAAAADIARHTPAAAGTALTDADATIAVAAGKWRKMPAATLSANRAITLGTTGAVADDQIQVTRLDVGAFTLAFVNGGAGAGTLYTMPVSKLAHAVFQFDGTNWALRSFGLGS